MCINHWYQHEARQNVWLYLCPRPRGEMEGLESVQLKPFSHDYSKICKALWCYWCCTKRIHKITPIRNSTKACNITNDKRYVKGTQIEVQNYIKAMFFNSFFFTFFNNSRGPICTSHWLMFFELMATKVQKPHNQLFGFVQDCSISIANAMEILQSCTKQSK